MSRIKNPQVKACATGVLLAALMAAQFIGPATDRAYRADFDKYVTDGQYAEAEAAARKAIAKAETEHGAESRETALAYDMLTEAYFYGDRVRDPVAEEYAMRAMAIHEKVAGPDSVGLAVSMRLMAHLMDAKGDYERARKYYEGAVRIHRRTAGKDPRQEANALSSFASLLAKTGDFAEARVAFEEALAIRQKYFAPDTLNTADAMIAYAALLREMGAYEQSRTYFRRGLEIQEKKLGADHVINAAGLNGLGALLNAMGKAAEAAPLLERTLAIEEKAFGPEHVDLAFVLTNLAASRTALGDLSGARALYERALRIAVNVYGEEHPEVARILSGYAGLLWKMGERQPAFEAAVQTERIGRAHVALTIRSLPERQALAYASRRPSGLDVAIQAAFADPSLRKRAFDEVIRSRALVYDEMAGRHRSAGRGRDARAVETARQRLAWLVLQGPESFKGAAYAEALKKARQENDAAEQALAEHSSSFQSLRRRDAAGEEEVASALSTGDALVSYVRYGAPLQYAAFIARPGQATQLVRLGAASRVEALVGEVRKQVLAEAENPGVSPKRAEAVYRAAGEALRKQVWDPLEGPLARARRVFVTPSDALNLVDFGALPANEEGYLAEHGPVLHYLSTERDAVLPSPAAGKGLLAIGNPSGGATHAGAVLRGGLTSCQDFGAMRFAPLPGAAAEVREIASVWRQAADGEVFERTGGAANKDTFQANSAGKRAVHVAAHAFFLGDGCKNAAAENPLLLSGFAMAGGGALTAGEIAAMDLQGVEWAVLSGCETGVGKVLPGEGVFGLRRAFQMAGARTVIMSLWPVDDESTRAWMRTLYREHLAKRRTTSEAVRAASLAALARRRAAGASTHPFYWAGFIAAGDWR